MARKLDDEDKDVARKKRLDVENGVPVDADDSDPDSEDSGETGDE